MFKRLLSWLCCAAMLMYSMAGCGVVPTKSATPVAPVAPVAPIVSATPVAVEVYLIDPCGGCQGAAGIDCKDCKIETEATNHYQSLIRAELEAGRATLSVYNMRKLPERYDERTERLEALGIERKNGPLPSVFVGGQLFTGSDDEAVLAAVRGLAVSAPTVVPNPSEKETSRESTAEELLSSSTVVYLFSPYCGDCKQIVGFIEQSAGERLVKYDISTEVGLEMEKAIYERFSIPEEKRVVPMVVASDTYLAGVKAIEAELPGLIESP